MARLALLETFETKITAVQKFPTRSATKYELVLHILVRDYQQFQDRYSKGISLMPLSMLRKVRKKNLEKCPESCMAINGLVCYLQMLEKLIELENMNVK